MSQSFGLPSCSPTVGLARSANCGCCKERSRKGLGCTFTRPAFPGHQCVRHISGCLCFLVSC
ncbi:uncharacterized protein B0H18DRAFT_1000951 [Fomitopsis serialis]|uniref:uncharacterized protein n=1 Tax=Fomitopsis serialis TaxID=139415 RepID=UPI002007F2CD|nr:uncharacterized protein B0H18DRAFT_1000951 [Neoantrodia serialis]KAH9928361.1 hypothetical protein B0H18DRAFT_1000951 [Neoantrodia serialis]